MLLFLVGSKYVDVTDLERVCTTFCPETEAEKASRILQKAKRMCPTDTSIDDLLAKAKGNQPSFADVFPCVWAGMMTPCKMKHVQKMLGGTFNLKTSQVNVACEKSGRDDESN